MPLLTSPSQLKLLFDENVDKRLERFLKQQGVDVISKPRELSNGELAEFSLAEQRVFVTNDSDFTHKFLYNKETIFSVVWLRIPQRRIDLSIKSFSLLLKEKTSSEDFEGKFITLYEDRFEISSLDSSKET